MKNFINNLKKYFIKDNCKYLSCPYLISGLSFTYEHIKACCAVKQGPVFIKGYKGEPINWENIKEQRTKIINDIKNGNIPEYCQDCIELKLDKWNEKQKIKHLFINHWTHCNCGCIYCSNIKKTQGKFDASQEQSQYYNLKPALKDLTAKKQLSEDAEVHFLGGDIGVLEEFDDLIKIINKNNVSKIFISTSGIKYMEALEESIQKLKTYIVISIDAGCEETYFKIKRTPSFNDVANNIERYAKNDLGDNQQITMKYIIVDGLNDNIEEIEKWLQLAKKLGIRTVRVDIDFCKYTYDTSSLPEHYYELFSYTRSRAKELNLHLSSYDYVDKLLTKCQLETN